MREVRRLYRRAGRNAADAAAYKAARVAVATQWLACYDLHRVVEVVSGDGDCMYGSLGRLVGCNPLVLRAAIIGFARCNPSWEPPGQGAWCLFGLVVRVDCK